MRTRIAVVLALVLGAVIVLPVAGWPGSGPRPVPTRVQTLDLESIAMAGGRGMSGVDQPTASQSSVIETDPFGLVGLSWDRPPADGSVVKVRVREESGWTSWMQVPFDDDHGPDPATEEGQRARMGSDPLLTGESDAVQVRVQTPDGQAPPNTEVHLVDTDNVDIQQPQLSEAAAAPGMPPIITRAQWGADESKRNRGPIYSDAVKVGFVHHTVSSSTYSESQAAAQMRNLYAWYTEGLKYSDMAYNFLVDRFGRLYEGRGGGMSRPVVGGHTAGLNNDSFAVSAMGNFDEFNPADPQMSAIKESIAELMAWKLGLTKRDPGGKDTLLSTGSLNSGYWEKGQTATLNRVSGHRDAGNTACPGKYLYAQVPSIRARAAQIYRNGGENSPPPAEIPDLITPDPVTNEFNFRGSGSGDGVGVPRAGVLGQARDGKKAAGILKHYLTDVAVSNAGDQRVIRVALANRTSLSIRSGALSKGGGAVKVGAGKSGLVAGPKTKIRARVSGENVVISRKAGKKWVTAVTAPKVPIRWAGTRQAGKLGSRATQVRVGKDLLRRGTVTISNVGGRLRVVANLRVHDEYLPYLQTVPTSWPLQAQRAMAIIARSSALAAVWNPDCGCHVGDAGFRGQSATTAKGYTNWRKAVNSTSSSDSGLSVLYADKPVSVPVFEATGGATLNSVDVRGEDLPWARSASDPWSLKKKNTSFASWATQTRPQSQVAQLFGLPDVVLLDLRTRMTGGAVSTAKATSSSGQTASITGEQLRTGLQLPSAYIARAATPAPTTATALSATLARRGGRPVVVQATDTTVVALAASYAGATNRPLFVVGSKGPGAKARKAIRPASSLTAVGGFTSTGLKSLSRLAKVKRVTAKKATSLSLKLAKLNSRDSRRTVFVASPGNTAAMASAAMGAARASGSLLAVDRAASTKTTKWVRKNAKRTIVVAGKKEIPNASAVALRRPVRLGASDPILRSARIAGLGSRRGEAILVDVTRPMAAAAAAATRQAVLFVSPKTSNAKALRFLQTSPAIATLRTVGADSTVVAAARRA